MFLPNFVSFSFFISFVLKNPLFVHTRKVSRPEQKIVCKCVLISFLGKISKQDTFYVPYLLDGISLYLVLDIYLCVYTY